MAYLEYFSEAKLALNQEVQNHPDLMQLLAKHGNGEFEIKLAEIAAYCEVILDGYYIDADLDEICRRLTDKLYKARVISVY